jgi:hypothetical protein
MGASGVENQETRLPADEHRFAAKGAAEKISQMRIKQNMNVET